MISYGVSNTQEKGQETICHIIRTDGRSLCGVVLTFGLGDSYAGWNLCVKCREVQ